MNLRSKIILKKAWLRLVPLYLTGIFIFVLTNSSLAQAQNNITDSTVIAQDTIALKSDTSGSTKPADSIAVRNLEDSLGIKISKDALSAIVTAEAADSAVLDMQQNIFYLYGDAKVKYEDLELDAGQVTYDQSTNMIVAQPSFDSAGLILTRPAFTQGSEHFTYDSLQYNFKTKRAIVRNARSQYGEGFVFSQQVKRNPDQSIYGWKNVYTTCSLDHPHFGIRAQRIKVIPNQVIASGSANIVVQDVPTPLFLPFGLFPISERQRSGFQLPTYTVENERGLGLTNGGYYFYINDYLDFLFMANIYSKGSWSASGINTYANRYRYNGGLSFSYAYNKTGETYEPGSSIRKDFMLNWRHQTDPKAKPGVSFNASVQVGTGSYYANNSYDVNQILNNNYSSNISYIKNWIGKPYTLTVSARHQQNTGTHVVDVSLPDLSFYVAQFNPLQRKNPIGDSRWYEKISVGYSFSGLNRITFYDTAFSFKTLALEDFSNGFHHSIPISASYNVLRFINMSFGTSYNEYWLTARNFKYFNNTTEKLDTLGSRGFFTARDFNATMQLSTRIYGLKLFKRGKLAGIRHVLTPNVGINYTPDFAAKPFNYYYQTRLSYGADLVYLSPFDGSVIGTPGLGQYGDFSSSVNFGLNNNLQIKVRSKDSAGGTKNITLIDGFDITSAYNIAADSFNWSPFALSFRTNILDKINVSANAVFDPYGTDYTTGRRTRETLWQQGNGIAKFRNANLALSANFRSKDKGNKDAPAVKTDEYNSLMQNGGYNSYVDFKIPWSINVAYAVSLNNSYTSFSHRDTLTANQSLLFSGDFNLTPRWKVTFSSGYDFDTHSLTITSIDIYRDLHCWEMRLGTIPFGPRKSYNFTLSVKASILQDLKLTRRRDFRDVVN